MASHNTLVTTYLDIKAQNQGTYLKCIWISIGILIYPNNLHSICTSVRINAQCVKPLSLMVVYCAALLWQELNGRQRDEGNVVPQRMWCYF